MNPSRDPLEQELARMRPAPLPRDLETRLLAAREEALAGAGRRVVAFPRGLLSPLVLAAAAALVLAGFLALPDRPAADPVVPSGPPPGDAPPLARGEPATTPTPAPGEAIPSAVPAGLAPEGYAPVGYRNTLLSAVDEGVVASEAGEPVRRLRYRSEDQYRFRDPSTGATVEVRVPREGILLVGLDPI